MSAERSSEAEALYRDGARACFENAEAILRDVELLYCEKRFARALSLAVIGSEEIGKGMLCMLAALDLVSGLREVLSSGNRNDPSRDHVLKQYAAEIVSVAHNMILDTKIEHGLGRPRVGRYGTPRLIAGR